MRIHLNKEFNCFEVTECHKTESIEFDGVLLVPVSVLTRLQLDKNQREILGNIIAESQLE